jgi:hypothetical protein
MCPRRCHRSVSSRLLHPASADLPLRTRGVKFFVSGKARWQIGWYPHYNCSGSSAFWGSFPNVWPYF